MIHLHPGIRYRQLLRETRLPNGSLSYHLKIMKLEKMIKCKQEGNSLWIFPVEMDAFWCMVLAETSWPTSKMIVSLLLDQQNGVTYKQIAAKTGRSCSTICEYLKRMQRAGLLSLTRSAGSRTVLYNLSNREKLLPILNEELLQVQSAKIRRGEKSWM